MRWLEKIRHIFASNQSYVKREQAGLQRGSLWEGVYDRSNTPKDGWSGIPKEYSKGSHLPKNQKMQ